MLVGADGAGGAGATTGGTTGTGGSRRHCNRRGWAGVGVFVAASSSTSTVTVSQSSLLGSLKHAGLVGDFVAVVGGVQLDHHLQHDLIADRLRPRSSLTSHVTVPLEPQSSIIEVDVKPAVIRHVDVTQSVSSG